MDVEKDEGQERLAPTGSGPSAVRLGGSRRGQVIDATMRLIAREGVAAVSTRKIAREAPINLATLHYLFGSKDDLLLAVLDTATSRIIGALALDVHPSKGLRAALETSIAALYDLLDRVPALPLIRSEVLLYAGRRTAQAANASRQQQRYLDALGAYYRMASTPGELDLIAFDALAAVVGSSIDGLALQMVAGVPPPQQGAARELMLRALLAMLATPTGP